MAQEIIGIRLNGVDYDYEDESTKQIADDNTIAIGDLSDLETEDKTNLVSAINEALSSGGVPREEIGELTDLTTTNKSNIVAAINEVDGHADDNADAIGTLADLTTTAKTNLVSAINEVDGHADDNADAIGTLANLATTVKTDLVSAINEVNSKIDTSIYTISVPTSNVSAGTGFPNSTGVKYPSSGFSVYTNSILVKILSSSIIFQLQNIEYDSFAISSGLAAWEGTIYARIDKSDFVAVTSNEYEWNLLLNKIFGESGASTLAISLIMQDTYGSPFLEFNTGCSVASVATDSNRSYITFALRLTHDSISSGTASGTRQVEGLLLC